MFCLGLSPPGFQTIMAGSTFSYLPSLKSVRRDDGSHADTPHDSKVLTLLSPYRAGTVLTLTACDFYFVDILRPWGLAWSGWWVF